MRLEGKIAMVIGAVQSIGRCIADRFVKEGALVAIVDYKSAATALLVGKRFHQRDVSPPGDRECVTFLICQTGTFLSGVYTNLIRVRL
jgi:NAD(P)-dependent dehydrogenase (short-subunit alcohol dehydrogenase family)